MNTDNTIEIVQLALDAALMREAAIANNIANNKSSNYQTIEVNFEQQLNDLESVNTASIKPYYQVREQHSSIEEQMALNVQNITHYKALIKGLNHKLAIMKLALEGNHS